MFVLLPADSVVIQAAIFRDNRASGNGGALSFVDSTPAGQIELNDLIIEGNIATYGGGVFVDSASSFNIRASMKSHPNSLRRNVAAAGGALFLSLKSLQKNVVQVRSRGYYRIKARAFLGLHNLGQVLLTCFV